MLLKRTSQYTNDLIRSGVRRQSGPAITDTSQIDVNNALRQSVAAEQVTDASKRLALGKERLSERGRMFDENLGLQKRSADFRNSMKSEELDQAMRDIKFNERQAKISNAISLGGVGLSFYDQYKANQKAEERKKIYQQMIGRLQKAGDSHSLLYADLAKIMMAGDK